MAIQKSLLWLSCLMFAAFGAGFLAYPRLISELAVGTSPFNSSAMIDMRATYGGMGMGAALFFLVCALKEETVRIGLVASFIFMACIAAGRLVGIFMDGNPNAFILLLLAAEVLFAALLAWALMSDTSSE